MNTNNGHLIAPELYKELRDAGQAADYEPVPARLVRAAQKKLAGKREAMVSLTSGGKLSQWAAEQRRGQQKTAKKRASRRRMAKATRKAQRAR